MSKSEWLQRRLENRLERYLPRTEPMTEITAQARELLAWIDEDDFAQYGECHGPELDSLVAAGYVQIHAPGEHQSGFIAQDPTGRKGDMYRAVSITDNGIQYLKSLVYGKDDQ